MATLTTPKQKAPAAKPAGGGPPASARRGRDRWFLIGWILAVLGTGGTMAFGILWAEGRSADARRAAAIDTARDFLVALTNFDARTIDEDFDRIESYAVGEFRDQADRFFGGDIRKALKERQASSRGHIASLMLQSRQGDRAEVFAVVEQTIVNNRLQTPQADELRIVLDLRHTRQGWRIAEVQVLQAPRTGLAATSPGNS